jgi:hypothetical protein
MKERQLGRVIDDKNHENARKEIHISTSIKHMNRREPAWILMLVNRERLEFGRK